MLVRTSCHVVAMRAVPSLLSRNDATTISVKTTKNEDHKRVVCALESKRPAEDNFQIVYGTELKQSGQSSKLAILLSDYSCSIRSGTLQKIWTGSTGYAW